MANKKEESELIKTTLLLLCILCIIAGIVWLFGPFIHNSDKSDYPLGLGLWGTPFIALLGPLSYLLDLDSNAVYIAVVLFYLALFFLTQWLFLNPKKLFPLKTKDTPRPMLKSIIGVTFVSTLLCVGVIYSIIDLLNSKFFEDIESHDSRTPFFLLLLLSIGLWILWSIIFFLYSRKSNYNTWSAKILRALLAGSVLELFISTAVYTTSKEECYCARGSYAGIVFGTTAMLWCFGPGIFFLYQKEKQRSEKLKELL